MKMNKEQTVDQAPNFQKVLPFLTCDTRGGVPVMEGHEKLAITW